LVPFAAVGIARGLSLARNPRRVRAIRTAKNPERKPTGVKPGPVPT